MSGGPDQLTALLGKRAALITRFVAELTALDAEIATQQRHNVQQTAAATTVAGYRTLQHQLELVADGAAGDAEAIHTLIRALQAQVNGLQGEVRGLVERERGDGA